jgi:hypothetical protein
MTIVTVDSTTPNLGERVIMKDRYLAECQDREGGW